jgi:CrcB protein
MSGVLLWAGVAVLGGAGAVARYLVGAAVMARAPWRLPLGTIAVNLSGALALGVLAGSSLHRDALLLAGTAVLGSYTTFSAWMFESERLAEDRRWLLVAVNVGGSLVLGVLAVALGRALAGG